MLEAKFKDNSKAIPKSSSIKPSRVDGFIIPSLSFKHIAMVGCNASKSNQWILDQFKAQLITTRNKESINYFKNISSKKRKHSSNYFNNILPTVIKDNNILELQGFLKHDFANKLVIKFKHAMLEFLTNTIQKVF